MTAEELAEAMYEGIRTHIVTAHTIQSHEKWSWIRPGFRKMWIDAAREVLHKLIPDNSIQQRSELEAAKRMLDLMEKEAATTIEAAVREYSENGTSEASAMCLRGLERIRDWRKPKSDH